MNFAITKATVTITPTSSQSKIYGVTDPTFTYSTSGIVNGTVDGVTISDTAGTVLNGGALSRATGETVGNYAITQGGLALSSGGSSNYNLSFTPSVNFAITKATVTVTPDSSQSKIYGVTDPTFTYGTSGIVNGTVDGVTISDTAGTVLNGGALSRATGETVGNYAITQGALTLSSGGSSNYTLSFGSGVNFAITKATVTVTPTSSQSKIYGVTDPTFTYGTSGIVNGTVDGVTISDTAGTVLNGGALSRATGETVGNYAITQGALALSSGGSSNYNLSFGSGVNFAITKATVTITPTSSQSKIYGVTDPTFTYGTSGIVNGTVDGVTISDTAGTVLNGGALSRATGETVGNYAITQGALGAELRRFVELHLSFGSGVNFAITKATVTITPDQQSVEDLWRHRPDLHLLDQRHRQWDG